MPEGQVLRDSLASGADSSDEPELREVGHAPQHLVKEDRGDQDLAAACGRVRLDHAGC
jgi:hypothetical protein